MELPLSYQNNRLHFLNRSLLGYVLLSIFFTFKTSAVELKVSDDLVIRDIDDKALAHSFLSTKKTINLTQGKHTLVLKYKDVFEDLDFAEERLITSDYFVVKFNIVNQKKLTLSTRNIHDLAAAERFVKSPELTLLDEHQQELILTLEKLSDYELAKQVTKVVSNLSVPTQVSNNENKEANKTQQTFNNKVIEKVDAMPMLKYWWKKASKDEKEDFLHFISESKNTIK